jgi:medium-chain acyl-[acyl-carrier-protein] hydrolase
MENACMFLSTDILLRIPRPNEQAQVRLVCFPPGGADAWIWDAYAAFLPASIELCAVQLPNRGPEMERYQERAQIIMEIARSLVDNAHPGQQLVFHGYCVGALWAYEVARYLRDHSQVQPADFIVAGCMAPHERAAQVAFMKTPAFIDVMTSFYEPGSPEYQYILSTMPSAHHDSDMLAQDMTGLQPPFTFPLSVLGTTHDQFVTDPQKLWAWQDYTTGPFHVEVLEGDHFFGLQQPQLLMDLLTKQIQSDLHLA